MHKLKMPTESAVLPASADSWPTQQPVNCSFRTVACFASQAVPQSTAVTARQNQAVTGLELHLDCQNTVAQSAVAVAATAWR